MGEQGEQAAVGEPGRFAVGAAPELAGALEWVASPEMRVSASTSSAVSCISLAARRNEA